MHVWTLWSFAGNTNVTDVFREENLSDNVILHPIHCTFVFGSSHLSMVALCHGGNGQ